MTPDVDAGGARIKCECDGKRCNCAGYAWCAVMRDGKRLRLCDRCDLSTDENRTQLTTAHLNREELEALAQHLEHAGTAMVQRSIQVSRIAAERAT